jgi:hypothetical protein
VDLLHLARCSKRLMHAADSTFAWQHCPPMRIRSSSSDVPPLSSLRLLRHVPSSLLWMDAPELDEWDPVSSAAASSLALDSLLALLSSLPHLHELDASEHDTLVTLTSALVPQLVRILQHPAARSESAPPRACR